MRDPPNDTESSFRRDELFPDTPFVDPTGPVQAKIAAAWREILSIDRVGAEDDFFELGGDSLQAVEMFVRLEEMFGVKLPPSTIIEHATVEALSRLFGPDALSTPSRCLVTLADGGASPALFMVHEASGNLLSYAPLVRRLGGVRRILGFQYPGQDLDPVPKLSVGEMASAYLEAMRGAQPNGPYHLVGYSLGGIIAQEMARQLAEAGLERGLLVLIDSGNRHGLLNRWQRRARRLSIHFDHLSNTPVRTWPGHVLKEIRKEALTPPRAWRRWADPVERAQQRLPKSLALLLNETLMTALDAHRVSPCPGNARLIRCMYGLGARLSARDLGWSGFITGHVDVNDLPTSHYDALSEPWVALVAAQLQSWLAEAEKAGTPARR